MRLTYYLLGKAILVFLPYDHVDPHFKTPGNIPH